MQIGQRRGEHLHLALERALDPGVRQGDDVPGRAFEQVALGPHDGEAFGHHLESSLDAVGAERLAAAAEADLGEAVHERRLALEQLPHAPVRIHRQLPVGAAQDLQTSRLGVDLDRALAGGVVRHGDGDGHLVAAGDLHRDFGLQAEGQARYDLGRRRPQPAIGRVTPG